MKRLVYINLGVWATVLVSVSGAPQEPRNDDPVKRAREHEAAVEHYTSVLERSGSRYPMELVQAYVTRGNHYYWLYWLERESRSEDRNGTFLGAAIADQEMAIGLSRQFCPGEDACTDWERMAREELAAYYRDALKDFDTAESQFRALIDLDPDEPMRYYALAELYEQFHDPEERPLLEQALELYKIPVQMSPDDPLAYRQVANHLSKFDQFEDAIEWLASARDVRSDDPEGYYLMAVHYWVKVYRDQTLTLLKRQEYISAGLRQLDQALAMNPHYVDALIYMSLLLREKAKIDDDPTIVAKADYYRDKGMAIRDRARGRQK